MLLPISTNAKFYRPYHRCKALWLRSTSADFTGLYEPKRLILDILLNYASAQNSAKIKHKFTAFADSKISYTRMPPSIKTGKNADCASAVLPPLR